jgi:hypothetical protein
MNKYRLHLMRTLISLAQIVEFEADDAILEYDEAETLHCIIDKDSTTFDLVIDSNALLYCNNKVDGNSFELYSKTFPEDDPPDPRGVAKRWRTA